MIVGLGTDIVSVSRIELVLMHESRLGNIFTEAEQEYCNTKFRSQGYYAGHWAAKEAYIKAHGEMELRPHHIEVTHEESGKPKIVISPDAPGIHDCAINVSISHENDYATAVVILERRKTSPYGD